MSAKLQDAVDMLTEISERADAMGISLVAYPVPDVREVLAGLRRAEMAARATRSKATGTGGES